MFDMNLILQKMPFVIAAMKEYFLKNTVALYSNRRLKFYFKFWNCIKIKDEHYFWAPYTWVSWGCSPIPVWNDGLLLSFKILQPTIASFTIKEQSLLGRGSLALISRYLYECSCHHLAGFKHWLLMLINNQQCRKEKTWNSPRLY